MKNNKVFKLISLILCLFLIFSVAGCENVFTSTPTPEAPSTSTSSITTQEEVTGSLRVEFLDVGQADCSLAFLPDGKILLVDAGDRGDGEEILSYIKSRGIEKIDFLVATHPHADHIGGMADIINELEIGKIFAPRVAAKDIPTSKTYEDFLMAVKQKGLKFTAAQKGATLFEGEGYKAVCFAPVKSEYDDLNSYSVVFNLIFGSHSVLFTGDAESDSEEDMLNSGFDLDCDILKVGHHGSSSSSSWQFLNSTTPDYAVISCGEDNSYNHPHKETLTSLENLKGLKKILRTDLDKTIVFTLDGKTENGIKYSVNNPTVVESK